MHPKNILTYNLPGITSQRIRKAPRRPVVTPDPHAKPKTYCPEIPVSDTYADGEPDKTE